MPPHKVLLVGPYPPPYGGLSVQLLHWQDFLANAEGWSCRVLNIGEQRREALKDCQEVLGYWDFWCKISGYAKQGYLIHLFTNGHNLKSWLCSFACTLAGCFNHRRTLLVFGSGNLPGFVRSRGRSVRCVMQATAKLSGHIVCRNEEMRQTFLSLGIPAAKLSILPGYYQSEVSIQPDEVSSDVQSFVREHHPILGATAIISPEYGVAYLLAALRVLKSDYPKIGLILIGIDSSLGVDENLQPHVLLPGPLPNRVVLWVMKHLTLFVRPTLFDGDSLSVREALSLRIPVVASSTGHRPEGVRLFRKGETPDLVRAIRQALSEEEDVGCHPHPHSSEEVKEEILDLYMRLFKAAC